MEHIKNFLTGLLFFLIVFAVISIPFIFDFKYGFICLLAFIAIITIYNVGKDIRSKK